MPTSGAGGRAQCDGDICVAHVPEAELLGVQTVMVVSAGIAYLQLVL